MFNFDPAALEAADPDRLIAGLRELRAGNRAVGKQIGDLARNIRTLRRIESEHGSLDAYVTSAEPETIARSLAVAGRPYKLRQLGFALAMEYLRNVGVSTAKPDTHVLRILGPERLSFFEHGASLDDVVRILARLAREAAITTSELDNLVWMFGAKGYGAICSAAPRCERCTLRLCCRRGRELRPTPPA
jgi:hypothetical protein